MESTRHQRTLRIVKALRATLVVLVTQVDELCDVIDTSAGAEHDALPVVAVGAGRTLRVERGAYTVQWGEKRCALGCSMAFRVIERLARRPNEYIPTDRLLNDLWSGPRVYSTVRSTVCRLKTRLREEGLSDLADMIDGSNPGHYGLMLRDR